MRTTPHQHRARRCLLAAAGALTLSPIAGTLLIDRCPMSARFPEANIIVERWHSRVPPPQIVFFGSSRTGCAVDEHTIEQILKRDIGDSPPVFNAAVGWGDPFTMRYLATHLFSTGTPPRLVILEVTPQSVARRHPSLDIVITRQFTLRDIVATGGEFVHSTNKAISRLLSSRLTPFYRHRDHLLAWAGEAADRRWDTGRRDRSKGTRPPAGGQPITPALGSHRHELLLPPQMQMENYLKRTRKYFADYEVTGRSPEALETLVVFCREKNVPVILLQTPLHSQVRALLGPAAMGNFRAFIERLQVRHGCRFVDISERISDSMLHDFEHANGAGRECFTRILAEEILGPVWSTEMQRFDEH